MGSRLELVLVWARGNRIWPLMLTEDTVVWIRGQEVAVIASRRIASAEVGQMGSKFPFAVIAMAWLFLVIMVETGGLGILVGSTYHADFDFLSRALRLLASSDGLGKETGLKRREYSILVRSSLLIVIGCWWIARSIDCRVI